MRIGTQKRIPLGSKIRVLVVDDSVVIRRLVARALAEDPAFEVVGTAANGAIALSKIPQVNPDAVTLDIEMPEMDGWEALRRIRKLYPTLCVIMFSTLTLRAATYTLDALALGANDYVTKAANVGSLNKSMASLRSQLIPKIKQFFEFEVQSAPLVSAKPQAERAGVPPRSLPWRKRSLVAIGVSTGGPNALAEIFPSLPSRFPCPILIVQHMPPLFTRMLAERLSAQSKVPVEEAAEGSVVEPGKALIAPGGYHMRLKRSGAQVVATLDQSPPVNSCRPAVDVLFSSVAEIYGSGALGVILTGMGQDGLEGAKQLKAQGACILAQDKATSVVWGMPGFVVEAGLADAVTGLDRIAPEILLHV